MKPSNAEVELSVEIRADRESVFRIMSDPDAFPRWMGPGSTLEPWEGGVVIVPFDNGIVAYGRVLEIAEYRLAFSWGYDPESDVPASVVRLTLHEGDEGTVLILRHGGLESEDERTGHMAGWRHYTAVLADVCLGDQASRIDEAVAAWIDSWNADDPRDRAKLLQSCYAEDGQFRDQGALIEDRADMDAYIEGARRFLPDAETRLDGGVDRCHEYLRFPVTISDGSGEPLRRGWQFAELGAEGRLRRIVAYWDQS